MATIKPLKIDDGTIRVPITDTDDREIGFFTFRPTDPSVSARLVAAGELAKEIKGPKEAQESLPEGIAQWSESTTAKVYALFDELLGEGAAKNVFKEINPLVVVGGNFVFETILEAITGLIEEALQEQAELREERLGKYLDGYAGAAA